MRCAPWTTRIHCSTPPAAHKRAAYQQRCAQPRPTRDKRHPRGAARLRRTAPAIPARQQRGRACPAQAAASFVRSTGSAAIAARQAASTFSGGMLLMPAPTTSARHQRRQDVARTIRVGLAEHAHVRHAHALRAICEGPQSLATIRRARSISADSSGMVRQYSIRNSGRAQAVDQFAGGPSGPSTKENCVPRPIEVLSRSASGCSARCSSA